MHKFHAVLHSVFLDAGSDAASFARYLEEFVAGTYDLGVEFGLSSIPPIDVRVLFPWAFPVEPVVAVAPAHPAVEEDGDSGGGEEDIWDGRDGGGDEDIWGEVEPPPLPPPAAAPVPPASTRQLAE